MKHFLRFFRIALTLAVAAAIVGSLWRRFGAWLEELPATAVKPKPFDPAFIRLSPREIAALPLAVRWDHPLGSQHAAMTYNAQPFRVTRHLGDDLNGIGGENSDLGDPVYAAGAGRVVYAGVPGSGWGNMIIVAHRLPAPERGGETPVVQSVYAHLDRILVRPNQTVQRGDQIGTVGTAGGQYLAHLHFEVRRGPYVNPSIGYADAPLNRVSPERFIAGNRGAFDDLLNPAPQPSAAEVEIEATTR